MGEGVLMVGREVLGLVGLEKKVVLEGICLWKYNDIFLKGFFLLKYREIRVEEVFSWENYY